MEINVHKDLVDRCRKHDRDAQFKIYKLFAKSMLNTAYRFTNDQHLAEDILQESFLSAFQKIDSYHEKATFGAWLKRIVINKSINAIHKNSPLEFMDQVYEMTDESETFESWKNIEKIKKAMVQLPKGARVVMNLYAFEGYDHQEISEILNISVEGSKSQYSRAKSKLKTIIEESWATI